ncbi:Elongation factor Tu GTP binding domain containing protein [Trichomonas vaginalis G3]|uniref:Elongation factor-like 1 n=1 Tax=Trichomonas vaginalis (strain ATCC PRA-98 / G3) TaxID=412133 RepID=A2EAD8_TRIV3|nr:elongation factor-like GTPase 1 family [Trichomonas vaginalis G3]EAY10365.1 Elongation factor Tu GTP binding domain containing protein [Trichomonas vaginalis G3]KAI5485352.1 elongation factor-like GTPase 1 family [Trichomonas vaginalis G3]|eukprot:XP_001322588.1 Elongation factor Tu GTP binding domain containing protein [Trichomonas vaginalis G3]
MFNFSHETVEKVISRPEHTLNFCILAHVDHGKTTLCDHLLSSNSIITKELAGEVRYMDCLQAERERNITMKTSAVSLIYRKENELFYLTVVDSPGHVDFEAEVSNAVRLSDGCLILVDAVEGVCVQTELVLRCAFNNNLKPILVINKVDRLFTELDLSPEDAELHLEQLLQEINAATLQEDPPFDPSIGNVVFVSCIGKWGFAVPDISSQFADKLGVTPEKAAELFWGLKYWDPKTKHITKRKPTPQSKTFFQQMLLTPIWKAYQEKCDITQLAQRLNVQVTARDTPISIISKWIPLSNSLLSTIVKFLPTPASAQPITIPKMCPGLLEEKYQKFFDAAKRVDKNGPMIAFSPKIVHGAMLHFPSESYPFVMYVRVYSGTIRPNDVLYVRHEKEPNVSKVTVKGLYLFMGSDLLEIKTAPAGCVVGIALEEPILKQSTFCHEEDFPLFTTVTHNAQPIVNVSIEAIKIADQASLLKGAELLAKIDPAVKISHEENGQLILHCMGEVHLQFCIDELKQHLAKVEFTTSLPLVPCKETIIDKTNEPKSVTMGRTTIYSSSFKLKQEIVDLLLSKNNWETKQLQQQLKEYLPDLYEKVIACSGSNLLVVSDEYKNLHNSLSAGFRLCVNNGPLCEEPLFGVCFIVEKIEIKQLTLAYLLQDDDDESFVSNSPLQFGESIACAKESFRQAFLQSQPRIMEPLYRCDVQCDYSVVGRAYDILLQHRCEIVEEKTKEGTNSCLITCYLPVIESFGFPNDLRSKTSGKAHPQLSFSHYKMVEDDPFWKPQTEEEIEEYGKDGKEIKPNVSKQIIEIVRKRKGIWTENIEQKADKRATVSRNK